MNFYDMPLKTFDPKFWQEEMLKQKHGTLFLIGEDRTINPEGDDTVELVFAQIIRTGDKNVSTTGLHQEDK